MLEYPGFNSDVYIHIWPTVVIWCQMWYALEFVIIVCNYIIGCMCGHSIHPRAVVWLAGSVVTGERQEVVPTRRWGSADNNRRAWWEGGGEQRLQELNPTGHPCTAGQLHQWTERRVRRGLLSHCIITVYYCVYRCFTYAWIHKNWTAVWLKYLPLTLMMTSITRLKLYLLLTTDIKLCVTLVATVS